ncbi:MAG: UDP-N-acetylmuramoyl-L-alanine--D-glutamate ligase [Pseudomonadota bacterium]
MASTLISSSRRKVVVGLGATGLSVARFLHRRGDEFAVVDTRLAPPFLDTFERELPKVPVFLGDRVAEVLASAGELIVSPGLSPEDPVLAEATAQGAVVRGDIDLFMEVARAPVVGITGSNAKSTVTAMFGAMARQAGVEVAVGGNLGTPALELLDEDVELYVLELSSFQLERAGNLNLDVATVLNVTPDHLDRHGNMQRYHQAKHRIFAGCRCAVFHAADPLTIPPLAGNREQIGWTLREPDLNGFGVREEEGQRVLVRGFDVLMPLSELSLPGEHNVANALACLALGEARSLPMDAMLSVLKSFPGLPHRAEVVATRGDVRWINDSKATNVGATLAAIQGLGKDNRLILLAGGRDKNSDFSELADAVATNCDYAVYFGEAGDKLYAALGDACEATRVETLAEAAALAAEHIQPGHIVLLSPACASFDQFASYEARGAAFTALAREWTAS